MTESYANYYHNPHVGRHGLMVGMKNDEPYCSRAVRALETRKTAWGEDLTQYERDTYTERALRDDDTCRCNPHRQGVVWSLVMSHVVDENMWNGILPLEDDYIREEEDRDNEVRAFNEARERELIMMIDKSYTV